MKTSQTQIGLKLLFAAMLVVRALTLSGTALAGGGGIGPRAAAQQGASLGPTPRITARDRTSAWHRGMPRFRRLSIPPIAG